MLVVDSFHWILGEFARQIVKWNPSFSFYFLTNKDLYEPSKRFKKLLPSLDLIHSLTPMHQWILKRALTEWGVTCPLVNSLYHVDAWMGEAEHTLQADHTYVMAPCWKKYLVEKRLPHQKISLILPGIESNKFRPENMESARKKHNIPRNNFVIGCLMKRPGNGNNRKGERTLIDVLKKYAPNAPVTFLLSGPGWDKEVRELQNNNVDVRYSPFVPARKVPDLYNAMDTYLVTSKVEGGPVPLLEAMASEVPPVTTPVGIARDAIRDKENGLLIPFDDVPATLTALEYMQSHPERRAEMGKEARKYITQYHNWEELGPQYGRMYKNLLVDCSPATCSDRDAAKQRREIYREDTLSWATTLEKGGHFLEAQRVLFCGFAKYGGLKSTIRRSVGVFRNAF